MTLLLLPLCRLLTTLLRGTGYLLAFGTPLVLLLLLAIDHLPSLQRWSLPLFILVLLPPLRYALRRAFRESSAPCRRRTGPILARAASRIIDAAGPLAPVTRRAALTLQQLADSGVVEALVPLGRCFAFGLGIAEQEKRAAECFHSAAKQGERQGWIELGLLFERRFADEKDARDALFCFKSAADLGDATGWFHLGRVFDEGALVAENPDKASRCYQRAGKLGLRRARERLVTMSRGEPPPERPGGPLPAHCPQCGKALRVARPRDARIGRCPHCRARYEAAFDIRGQLHMRLKEEPRGELPPGDAGRRTGAASAVLTPERAWALFGLPPTAGADELRNAYKRLISKYHPDKVANLGEELRQLAEQKSKVITQAYRLLAGAMAGR